MIGITWINLIWITKIFLLKPGGLKVLFCWEANKNFALNYAQQEINFAAIKITFGFVCLCASLKIYSMLKNALSCELKKLRK